MLPGKIRCAALVIGHRAWAQYDKRVWAKNMVPWSSQKLFKELYCSRMGVSRLKASFFSESEVNLTEVDCIFETPQRCWNDLNKMFDKYLHENHSEMVATR